MRHRLARFALGLLCLIAAGLFGATLNSEIKFALQERAALPAVVAALPTSLPLGASDRSRVIVLDNCYDLLRSYYLRALPTAARVASTSGCAAIAEAIVRQTPTHGYAWLIAALAQRQMGDIPGYNTAMVQSRAGSPNVGWLLQRRAMLLEDDFDRLDQPAREAQAADFASMMRSKSGICTLAKLYRDEPQSRERINVAVAASAARDAEVFLKQAAGQDTGRCS